MLDSLIQNYLMAHAELVSRLNEAQASGGDISVIPNREIEGAPQTVGEYICALEGMLFLAEKVLFDLNALRIERLIDTVAQEQEYH